MKNFKLVVIDTKRLHHAEFGQFIDRLFNDMEQGSLDLDTDANFKMLFDQLKEKSPFYSKALEQVRENENTQKIAELDRMRNDDFTALRDSIKPYRKIREEKQKQAYDLLKIVFDDCKKLTGLNYEAKTKKLSTLLSQLKGVEYQSQISVLNILGFVQRLEKSNTEFDKLFAQRSAQYMAKETYDTKTLRREMTEIYRKWCLYTEMLADISQDGFYKKALEIINNSRKYFADLLAKREGVNKSKKKAEEKENKGNSVEQ